MSQAKHLASHLSGYGRYGDSMLMHVNPEEVRALNMMAGIAGRHITTNPDTGLPEAFNLFDILPFAVNLIAPGMGTAAQVALGAASGAASSAVEGGDPLTGALTGGVMGGIGGDLFGGGATPAPTAKAAEEALAKPLIDQAGNVAAAADVGKLALAEAPTQYATDLLGKGSDEFVGNLFSGKNLPYTIAGATALGSMLPGQEYKEEEEEYGPKNEWRPGEGYVPFQQAGVRSFTPGMISPTGVEQSWIGYGPSADPSTYRRFADGGQVSVADQLSNIRGPSQPYSLTTSTSKKGGTPGRVQGRVGAGRFRRNNPQAPQPQAPRQPAVVTPPDPMQLVQGGQNVGTPAFSPALYSPVGRGPDTYESVMAFRNGMKGGDGAPQINPGMNQGGSVGMGASASSPQGGAQQAGGKVGMPGSSNEGRPWWYGSDFKPAEGSSKGGLPSATSQPIDATAQQRNNPMQMPASAAPQAGNNDMQEQAMRNGGYVRRYADGGEVKSNDLTDFFTMGAVPFALNKIMDGGPWKLGLLGLPNLLNDRDKRGAAPTVGPAPATPGPGPGMRNGGYVRRYADGGPVMDGIAQGMQMPPMQEPAPMGVPMDAAMPQGAPQIDDQTLVRAAAAALSGQIPDGGPIIQMFVAKFGEQALQQLMAMVNPQIPENMGRLLKGPGDGRSDSIPAAIDGVAPAKLSTGEFVVPAKAVSKLGRGSTDAGAQKLQSMVNKVNRKSFETAPGVIDDMEPMRV